ncbi:MAG TPA: amidohydrolase family protein, partial [Thermoleophilaceae bacterium]|nr:amidohydrolase family protein [Thermoleophilaceae bacterium]
MQRQLVLAGGTIRTLDRRAAVVDHLAVGGGRIAAGRDPAARQVNLGGACVLPGLNDSHVHFPTWSLAQRQVRLEDTRTRAEALDRVALALPGVPRGAWLRGFGWRSADWTEAPERGAIDRMAGDVPVALWAKDYHSLWLNGAALARADAPLEVPGGLVERDRHGEPTGVLRENAAWTFRDRYLIPTLDEMVDASRDGLAIAAARGVTAVHDKDGWMRSFEVFQRLQDEGELTLRVWQSLPADRLAELRALGLRSGFGNEWLRLGYLKVFMDGTLGSATAHLLDGSGVEITSASRLAEIVREAAAAGWPVGVHAIGDAANRAALDAFEATAEAWRPLGLRQRIEHAQLL